MNLQTIIIILSLLQIISSINLYNLNKKVKSKRYEKISKITPSIFALTFIIIIPTLIFEIIVAIELLKSTKELSIPICTLFMMIGVFHKMYIHNSSVNAYIYIDNYYKYLHVIKDIQTPKEITYHTETENGRSVIPYLKLLYLNKNNKIKYTLFAKNNKEEEIKKLLLLKGNQ